MKNLRIICFALCLVQLSCLKQNQDSSHFHNAPLGLYKAVSESSFGGSTERTEDTICLSQKVIDEFTAKAKNSKQKLY